MYTTHATGKSVTKTTSIFVNQLNFLYKHDNDVHLKKSAVNPCIKMIKENCIYCGFFLNSIENVFSLEYLNTFHFLR